ncbi:MAG: bifunctional nuclease family protein [Planctomycetes bacterium]|nr:bifunctional nuclease family protein [Planctomycetota bacterium]
MVPFTLSRIIFNTTHSVQHIILKEVNGLRHFPIQIGDAEAGAIYRRAMKRYHQRPLTHDLIDRVVAGMGGTLKAVEICDLKEHTYYANLVIETADGQVRIDARPSDAIALLVGNNVDLLVDDTRVLEAMFGEGEAP